MIKVNPAQDEIHAMYGSKFGRTFTFDQVYSSHATQEAVYCQTVQPIVTEVLKGFNCTVFAYGQTGTGKTFTMEGPLLSEGRGFTHDWYGANAGMIGRSVAAIFEHLEKNAQKSEYSVRVSYLELHNETMHDLFVEEGAPSSSSSSSSSSSASSKDVKLLKILKTQTGIVVNGLEEITVDRADDVFRLLDSAMQRRHVAETNLNKHSSRSHSIFTIVIHTKESTITGENVMRVGKLNLVDLAGSENASRSGAQGDRQLEASAINTSLLTLGRVITALTANESHIPYRNSKLTRLLEESLGGRAKTAIIATISPSATNIDQTMSTLDYAHRAKSIRNRPEQNQRIGKEVLLREYTDEIEMVRRQLQQQRLKDGCIRLSNEEYERVQTIQVELEGRIEELQCKLTEQDKMVADTNERYAGVRTELQETVQALELVTATLKEVQSSLEEEERKNAELSKKWLQQCDELEQQKQAEQVLKQDNEKLVTVLDMTTAHVEALHSKRERMKVINVASVREANALRQSLLGTIEAERQGLATVLSLTAEGEKRIGETVEQTKAQAMDKLEGIIGAIPTCVEALAKPFNKLIQSAEQLRDGSSGRWESLLEKEREFAERQEQSEAKLVKRVDEQQRTLVGHAAEHNKEVRKLAEQVKNETQAQQGSSTTYASRQSTLLSALDGVRKTDLEVQGKNAVENMLEVIRQSKEEMLRKLRKDQEVTMKAIQALQQSVAVQFQEQSKSVESMCEQFTCMATLMGEQLTTTSQQLAKHVEEAVAVNVQHEQETEERCKRVQNVAAKLKKTSGKSDKAVQSSAARLAATVVKATEQLAEQHSEHIGQNVVPLVDEANSSCERFVERTTGVTKSIHDGQEAYVRNLNTEVFRCREFVRTSALHTVDALIANGKQIREVAQQQCEPCLARMTTDLDRFVVLDIDDPTGCTPIKQTYDYRRTFAGTRLRLRELELSALPAADSPVRQLVLPEKDEVEAVVDAQLAVIDEPLTSSQGPSLSFLASPSLPSSPIIIDETEPLKEEPTELETEVENAVEVESNRAPAAAVRPVLRKSATAIKKVAPASTTSSTAPTALRSRTATTTERRTTATTATTAAQPSLRRSATVRR